MELQNPRGGPRYKNPEARAKALAVLESLDPEVATELKRLFTNEEQTAHRQRRAAKAAS